MGNKPSTFDLYCRALSFLDQLIDGEGVVEDGFEEALAEFLEEADDKIAAHRAVTVQFDAQIEVIAAEQKRLAARKKALGVKRDRLKEVSLSLVRAQLELPGAPIDYKNARKLNFGTYSVAVSSTKSVEIANPAAFATKHKGTDLVRTKIEPNKTLAKKRLTEGESIDGAELIEKESLRWS